MRTSVSSQLYLMKMLISVIILSWAIMVVEECCSLVDL